MPLSDNTFSPYQHQQAQATDQLRNGTSEQPLEISVVAGNISTAEAVSFTLALGAPKCIEGARVQPYRWPACTHR